MPRLMMRSCPAPMPISKSGSSSVKVRSSPSSAPAVLEQSVFWPVVFCAGTAQRASVLRPSVRVFVYYESLSLTVTSRAGSYASSSHLAFCRVFIFLVVRFSCVPIRGGTPPTFIAEDYCGLTDRPTEDGPRQVCGVTKFASGIGDRFLLCSLVR